MNKIIEICCGSYEDALAAYRAGAKRIELNSALHLGGLTPSLGTLRLVKQNTDLKVIVMVRPRGAGFCYSEADFEMIKNTAKELVTMDTVFYTGHCTGDVAYKILKEQMGEKLIAISDI